MGFDHEFWSAELSGQGVGRYSFRDLVCRAYGVVGLKNGVLGGSFHYQI